MKIVSALAAAKPDEEPAHRVPMRVNATKMTSRRFFIETSPWSVRPKLQNLVVSDAGSLLGAADGRAVGTGADPSPIMLTAVVALTEAAPPTALRAPASIKAARVAIMVFFIFTTSD
jgi:hypothetical protein